MNSNDQNFSSRQMVVENKRQTIDSFTSGGCNSQGNTIRLRDKSPAMMLSKDQLIEANKELEEEVVSLKKQL